MKAEVRNPSGALTDCLLTDQADGTYAVEYTPFENGNGFPSDCRCVNTRVLLHAGSGAFQASTVFTFCTTTRQFLEAPSGCRWQRDATPAGS